MSKRQASELRGRRLSRRNLLRAAGALAGFSATNFLIPRELLAQDKLTGELVVTTWGGSFADAVRTTVVEPFQKEYGVRVTMGVTGNQAEMLTKLRASTMGGTPDIDLCFNDLSFSYSAIKQGLVEPLRVENIPNLKTVLPIFNKLERAVPWDPGPDIHGAPGQYVARGITYNTKLIKRDITSVADLWNPEFTGKLGIFSITQWMMLNAGFYTSQDMNNFKDLDAIWKALAEQRKIVGRYYGNLAEGQELFVNETISISPFNGGRTVALKRRGMDVRFVLPKEGFHLNADLLLISKGTRNRLAAEKFIDFFYRPDIATAASLGFGFAVGTRNVQPTDAIKDTIPDYDPTGEFKGATLADPVYWDTNVGRWNDKVKEIMSS
ncbi:MAG TPA: extracellular solute-binding protein [Stellaceae bacterium]|nr:extracellular solute-binding protein [Stellaceae bacterium]